MQHACPWRGIVLPLVLGAIGIPCIVTQTAWIPGRYAQPIVLHGTPGIVMGLMFIALAVGLNLRHFWIGIESFGRTAEFLGMIAYIASVTLLVVLLGMTLRAIF